MKAILLGDAMIPGEGFGKAWEKHLSKYGNDVIVDKCGRIYCGMLAENYFDVEKRGKHGKFYLFENGKEDD